MEVKLIGTNHPLYGHKAAWFLFSIQDKSLLVHAKNEHAVSFLELISRAGRVSPNCALVSVHLQEPAVLSSSVERVRLSDFVIDLVDFNGEAGTSLAMWTLQQALSSGDKIHLERRLDAIQRMKDDHLSSELDKVDFAPTSPEEKETKAITQNGEMNAEKIMAAMVDLGFKSAQAKRFIGGLGSRLETESLETLIREGIVELGS